MNTDKAVNTSPRTAGPETDKSIKTGTDMSRAARADVSRQSSEYRKEGSYKGSPASVGSRIDKTPENVGGIKTENTPVKQPESGYRAAGIIPGRTEAPGSRVKTPEAQTVSAAAAGKQTDALTRSQTEQPSLREANNSAAVAKRGTRNPVGLATRGDTEKNSQPVGTGMPGLNRYKAEAKTGTEISREAEDNVRQNISDHSKAGLYKGEQASVGSRINKTPNNVGGIKTADTSVKQPGPGYREAATAGKAEPSGNNSKTSEAGMPAMNRYQTTAKTGTEISREAEDNARRNISGHGNADFYKGEQESAGSRTNTQPVDVSGIRTTGSVRQAADMSGGGEAAENWIPYAPGTGASKLPGQGRTLNVKTGSEIMAEKAGSIYRQSAEFNKDYEAAASEIQNRIRVVPGHTSGIKTGHPRAGHSPSVAGKAATKAKNALESQDDLGAQTAANVIGGVQGTVQAYRTAKTVGKAASATGRGLYTAGKGVYQVGLTGTLMVITVGKTARAIKSGGGAVSHGVIKELRAQAAVTGLNHTAITKNIIHAANGIRTRASAGVKTLQAGGLKGAAKAGGKAIVKGAAKSGVFIAKSGGKTLAFAGKKGLPAISSAMASSEDPTVSGIGNVATATEMAIRTSIKAGRATGYTVKTSVKAGTNVAKGAVKGVNFIRANGLKAAWQAGRKKAGQAVAQAGVSVVQKAIAGVKAVASKFLIPVLVIILAIFIVVLTCSSGVLSMGTIFSGTFGISDTDTEYDVDEFLESVIPGYSEDYKQTLASRMERSANRYDAVRLYANTGSTEVVDPTYEGLSSVFPTDSEIVDMLAPLFNAILLMQYDLEPTQAEAEALAYSLFIRLFTYTTEETTEYCGQDLATGEGEAVVCSECGQVHALDGCPNAVTGTHSEYTCSTCDSYVCYGHQGSLTCGSTAHTHTDSCYETVLTCTKTEHEHTWADGCYELQVVDGVYTAVVVCEEEEHEHSDSCYTTRLKCGYSSEHTHSAWNSADDPGCYSTTYCDGCIFQCSGYSYCGGHSVMTYTFTMDGIYALVAEYFTDPINELLAIENRTEEQEEELTQLQEYYEIFEEMASEASGTYSSNISTSELSNVNFVNGSRVANQDVVDLALSQVGNTGGETYWSYYGFESRVAWCACFVHWCMRNTPSATDAYPETSNNAYCQTVADWFESNGQWGEPGYTDLVAGDVIFFDWGGDGHTDHVGIVVGQDGTYVYTVEGNSGDAVKTKSYNLDSTVIYGYGLMNY